MRCEKFERLLSRYVDGDLEPGVNDAASEHARVCMVCEARLAEYQRMREQLRALGDSVPDLETGTDDYWNLIEARIDGRPSSRNVFAGPRKWAVPSAAAAVVLFGVVISFPILTKQKPPSPAEIAAKPALETEDAARSGDSSPSDAQAPSRGVNVNLVPVGGDSQWSGSAPSPADSERQETIWF